MLLLAAVNCVSRLLINAEQSFSMYMPYADTTILRVDSEPHCDATISEHWACTALYNASPVRLDMFVPPIKSVEFHIAEISPAMSSVPWVDKACFFVLAKTALMPASFFALSDVSWAFSWADSPAVADVIALTSAAVLSMTYIFKS